MLPFCLNLRICPYALKRNTVELISWTWKNNYKYRVIKKKLQINIITTAIHTWLGSETLLGGECPQGLFPQEVNLPFHQWTTWTWLESTTENTNRNDISIVFLFPLTRRVTADTHRRWALGAFEHRRAGHQRLMQTVVVVWALKRVQNSRSSWSLGCYMNLCYISHLKNGVQRQAGYVLIRKENGWKTADSWKYQQLGVVNILFGYTLLRLINNDQKSTDRVIYLIATCFDAIFTRWLMLLIKYSQRNETQTSPTAISDGLPTSDLIFAHDVQTNHNSAEPAKQPIRWGERATFRLDVTSFRTFTTLLRGLPQQQAGGVNTTAVS